MRKEYHRIPRREFIKLTGITSVAMLCAPAVHLTNQKFQDNKATTTVGTSYPAGHLQGTFKV